MTAPRKKVSKATPAPPAPVHKPRQAPKEPKAPLGSRKRPQQDGPELPAARPDDMSPEVVEFIQAVDRYKREHDRKFPNLSEILRIVKDLGYAKLG